MPTVAHCSISKYVLFCKITISLLFYDDGTRANDIVEGAKQGSPASAHLSAIALQPLLKKYDAKMQKHDGWVKAIADDVYLVGPPKAVAAVYPEYKGGSEEDRQQAERAQERGATGPRMRAANRFPDT